MRFGWLIPVVLLVVVATTVAGWMLARRAGERSGKKGWVANTGFLRDLPKYQALVRRTRSSLAMAVVCFLIAVIATSDSEIGDSFKQIISHFEGERISLQLWNAYSMTMFPLTDDYEMANEVLTEMADKIDRGFNQIGNKIYLTRELEAYLQPTFSGPDDRRGSLVGDGLASCVLGFDHTDKKRSRTILLATDNEVFGEGIYNLAESIEFAKSQGVTVSVLYPGSSYSLKAEGAELQDQVKSTGGSFYDASSPSAVDEVVRQIVGVLSLLGLLAFGRL